MKKRASTARQTPADALSPSSEHSDAASASPSTPPSDTIAPFDPPAFHGTLLTWYRRHARDLPWRGVDDPYATWLSEIMLQQTRVATVIERYREFLLRFPTIRALAEAPEEEVLALWSGLGYYRRARLLHRAAQFVTRELKGRLPPTAVELRTLPGVGDYTAAAIASIAYGERIAVVDGNVERVVLRVLGKPEDRSAATRTLIQQTAQSLVPAPAQPRSRSNPCGDHNQAMMELGATICLPRAPLCLQCPVLAFCRTRGEHPTGERQKMQSRTVAHLLLERARGTTPEVLLHRRPAGSSLMPGMLELPPLPDDAVEGLEPALRVRHAITNTNYYVTIFRERAPGLPAETADLSDDVDSPHEIAARAAVTARKAAPPTPSSRLDPDDQPYVAPPGATDDRLSLVDSIAAAADDLAWHPTHRLLHLPLTGLTRKVLQRLKVLDLPKPTRRTP